MYHKSVLLEKAVEHLQVNKGKKYIDATLGDGGHTLEILKHGGIVLGLDVSDVAIERARKRIEKEGLEANFKGMVGNFKDIDTLGQQNGFESVSGVIYDLGYSSFELDEGGFGISFQKDEPLDMRLDKSLGVTASDLVNSLSESQLSEIIFRFSDEKFAKKIARGIVKARNLKKIQTTRQLADLIKSETFPGYEHGRIHPATRTFQALRIAVNDEINNLERSLPRAARLLLPGSKIVVICFHSLEDKVAKQFGRSARPSISEVTKKPIVPEKQEVGLNPRSRSARMRVFIKNS